MHPDDAEYFLKINLCEHFHMPWDRVDDIDADDVMRARRHWEHQAAFAREKRGKKTSVISEGLEESDYAREDDE